MTPSTFLAVDLSTSCADLALVRNGDVLSHESWPENHTARQRLFKAIPAVCETAGIDASEIDGYVTGLGPGSFSGIRMSIAALCAMVQPSNAFVGGIPSGEIMAIEALAEHDCERVTVVGDARRKRLWRATFQKDAGDVISVAPFELLTWESFETELQEDTLVISPDWHRIGEPLHDICNDRIPVIERAGSPSATTLAQAARRRLDRGTSLAAPVPLYLHPPVFVPPKPT